MSDEIQNELNDRLRRSLNQAKPSVDKPLSQRIIGNNNQQAAGDLHVHYPPHLKLIEFDPDNPNIIPCPTCRRPTSIIAQPCLSCGCNVKEYRENEYRKEQLKALKKRKDKTYMVAYGLAFLGMLTIFLSDYFDYSPLNIVSVLFLGLSVIIIRALEL